MGNSAITVFCFYCTCLLGKLRKQPLYVVEVATKGTSNLELENTDLIEPDFLIQSGKKNDATEAEAAKENGQKSAQKEETEIVTLATFGLPPVVTEELQGMAAIGSQLDKEQESKIEEEGKGASEVATSRVVESTQQKVHRNVFCGSWHGNSSCC